MFLYSNVLVISLFQWPIYFDIVFTNFNLGVGYYSPGSPPSGRASECNEPDLCRTLHLEQQNRIIIRLQSFATAERSEIFTACVFGGPEHTHILLALYSRES